METNNNMEKELVQPAQQEVIVNNDIEISKAFQKDLAPVIDSYLKTQMQISLMIKYYLLGMGIDDKNYYLSGDGTKLIYINNNQEKHYNINVDNIKES